MTDQEDEPRKKYEKPEVLSLSVTKALGDCQTGSGDDNCIAVGNSANDCIATGNSAASACATGSAAPPL